MNIRASLFAFCSSVIAASMAIAPAASAAEYPVRPIKLVVPYAAGGPTDVLGRLISDFVGKDLKQTTIVENTISSASGSASPRRPNCRTMSPTRSAPA